MSSIAMATIAAISPLWGELQPGPHRVGFELIEVYDYSRPFRSAGPNRARPVTLSIWYPADEDDSGERIPFGRYVVETGRDALVERIRLNGIELSGPDVDGLLDELTNAYMGAHRAEGSFPVLLFAGGLTAPSYLNSVLCEYLASHGYVSLSLPSLPRREDAVAEFDQLGLDTQLRDMEFAIQSVHDYDHADISRMGLVGASFGGVSQALLQMKNPDVRAVVSLDAATGYEYGRRLLEDSIFFDPAAATAPFFHATSSEESDGRTRKSTRYFDTVVRGDAYRLTLDGATHAEFTSLGGAVAYTLLTKKGSSVDRTRYDLLCLYVRRFLDAAIKEDPTAREFLAVAPARHGFEGLVLTRKR
ncbi:MAG TPA: hypothetical protein VLK65_15975 [Vicinamibacteria bacterium]|nr:hypothetical protein [Vicinamibacteria bacterium]